MESHSSTLSSIGLSCLSGGDEDDVVLGEVGERVKSLISTYEAGLDIRQGYKRPPADIYKQMVSELRLGLSVDDYELVVKVLVSEVALRLNRDKTLWSKSYTHSTESRAVRNIYKFVSIAMEAQE